MAFYTWEAHCNYPAPGGCVFQTAADASAFQNVIRLCPHHAPLRIALTDAEIFARVLAQGRELEEAKALAKLTLGLEKDDPGVPWQIEIDGTASLVVGDHPRRAAVAAALAQVNRTRLVRVI